MVTDFHLEVAKPQGSSISFVEHFKCNVSHGRIAACIQFDKNVAINFRKCKCCCGCEFVAEFFFFDSKKQKKIVEKKTPTKKIIEIFFHHN